MKIAIAQGPSQPHKEIYIYLGNTGVIPQKIIKKYHIKDIFLINGSAIDPGDKGQLNEKSLKNEIARVIPNVDSKGIAILDWEGRGMHKLIYTSVEDSDYIFILSEYMKMIDIAKSFRPQVKWGIYGLPVRNYWNRNQIWKSRSFMLEPLLNKCDLISPSLYDLYPDSLLQTENKKYLEDNLCLALEIGKQLNKPVLPFVTHRWPNSEKIPEKEFIKHIDTIFKTKFAGEGVSGIIWWGPDQYYFNNNNKIVRQEVGTDNFLHYFGNLVKAYLSVIVHLRSFRN